MKVKVHWIIDGIAEIEAESLEQAEQLIEDRLNLLAEGLSLRKWNFLVLERCREKLICPGRMKIKKN